MNEKKLLFWCGFVLMIVCFVLTMVQNRLHDEKIFEMVGYYPDKLPKYQRELAYVSSDNVGAEVAPYDPANETLDDYKWRVYLAELQREDVRLWEEEVEKDEAAQKEFYMQQEANLREAQRVASREVDNRFILYYVIAILAAIIIAAAGVWRLRRTKTAADTTV